MFEVLYENKGYPKLSEIELDGLGIVPNGQPIMFDESVVVNYCINNNIANDNDFINRLKSNPFIKSVKPVSIDNQATTNKTEGSK